MDELNGEQRTTDLGVQYGYIILICFLFMVDIALLGRSAKKWPEMLNIVNLFLDKWYLELSIKKEQLWYLETVSTKTYNNQFQIGTEKLNIRKQYKYLSEHLTENLILAYHLNEKKCQTQGIIHSCLLVSIDIFIADIEMASLVKLYHTVIVPAIVCSCKPCKTNNIKLYKIQISVLRSILKLPISTLLVKFYIETAIFLLNLDSEKR